MTNDRRSALLIVDVQNDFCPGGALPVPHGDRVVPVLNRYVSDAVEHGMPVYASRDWHPAVTRHFNAYGGEWSPHCVQNTEGGRFHADLQLPSSAIVVSKGQDPDKPGYSALEGYTDDGKTLLADLRARHVDHLYVGGLATDYCVRATAIEAMAKGFSTIVLIDAVRAVDVEPRDGTNALQDMAEAGAALQTAAGLHS